MQQQCSEQDCDRWAKWRGLCQRHYIADQYRDKPVPSDEEIYQRLLRRIVKNPETECWEWQGAGHARYGHGMFGYNAEGRNTTLYVHSWMYQHLVGPVPEGLVLDHLCRVPKCCNPQHLEPVTNEENIRRGGNSLKTHCKRGHPLAGDNLHIRQRGDKQERWCKECGRMRARERRAK